MPTPQKEATINEMVEWLKGSQAAVLTDYRGLTVQELNELRRRLREVGVEYHITKNTLLRQAAQQLGQGAITPLLEGPTAVAFSKRGETEAAKALTDYTRTTRTVLKIKGGLLGDQTLTPARVEQLATLPPKAELVGKVLGGLKSPLYSLAGVLQGNIRQLINVLDQHRQQLGASPAEGA